MSAQVVQARPSDERRKALTDAEGDMMGGEKRGVPLVSNFFPVERYCNAADKVLDSFRQAYDERRLDDAYVLGKRFACFSLDALPTHNYYRSPKLAQWRKKNSDDMNQVIAMLEKVVKWMDEEELERQKLYAKQQQEEKRRYQELQQRIQQQRTRKQQQRSAVSSSIEQSAMSKLQHLKEQYGHEQQQHTDTNSSRMRRQTSSSDGSSVDSGSAAARSMRSPHHVHDITDVSHPGERRSSLDRTESRRGMVRESSRRSGESPRRLIRQGSSRSIGSNGRVGSRSPGLDGHSSHSHSKSPSRRLVMEEDDSYRSRSTRAIGSRRDLGQARSDESSESGQSGDRRRAMTRAESRRSSMSAGDEPRDAYRRSSSRRFTMDHFSTEQSSSADSLEVALSKLRTSKMQKSNRSIASDRSRPRRGDSDTGEEPLPPPVPPPQMNGGAPPPPSYSQVMGETRPADKLSHVNNLYDRSVGVRRSIAAAAGGAYVADRRGPTVSYPHSGPVSVSVSPDFERDRRPVAPVEETIPIRKLRDKSASEYRRLQEEKKVSVFALDTYQGRVPQSTNGCTVISPLVVAHHLNSRGSVADSTIVDVIDKQCGPLLREIRSKLGLEGDSLIIPSDVHDHLVDKKILSQSMFIGASGGNILNREHLGEFLKLLEGGEKGSHKSKRTGAALFFKEHVVSIVKVPVGPGKFAYDLVDSLPGVTDKNNNHRATRTRCRDIASFEALIRWYACNKFSESNLNYIDHNEWDENMADFDCRVFQAFVWAE